MNRKSQTNRASEMNRKAGSDVVKDDSGVPDIHPKYQGSVPHRITDTNQRRIRTLQAFVDCISNVPISLF
ncbi:unnamed protein product [Cercopithifilaria johnstoni]|uniref:Uncharacterized protein n=1 Tax=Cercopithifilaria johnstoni TaxID=2874296 RepID=A0A8J2M223_9BILA|nr:unnamed protein product [Cercopithifilaria johnstoni]